jgi:UDPglucose 6-dehydrogenase
MTNLCVLGVGYVGLVTGTCFADLGNCVTCVDVDEDRINRLRAGQMPIYEPGLEEMVRRNVAVGRLRFGTSVAEALSDVEFVFIAVGTPSGPEGEADLTYVRAAARSVAEAMNHYLIIVNKSTVPIGTGDWVSDIVERHKPQDCGFAVVSNPEFLREGSAVADFMNPDRIVLGSLNQEAAGAVARLYLSLRAPIVVTDLRTAEMIKYASNAFLANRISFINEIASICEALGADVKEVAAGMGYDKRIGRHFLDAGVGYGGSCFPKDVKALEHMAAVHGCHPQLLRAVMEINRDQRRWVIQKLRDILGSLQDKQIGVLGLAFKPNTDDIRESPAVEIIHLLQHEGATVKVYDPVAHENARRVLHDVTFCPNVYETARASDALVVLTEWNEFKHLDMPAIKALMRQPVLIDGRNIYDMPDMKKLGFVYRGVGRAYEG